MKRHLASRRVAVAVALATLLIGAALPASAVNIPEGGAVTPGSTFLIHFQVTSGCDGLPTNELEVTVPENVTNPTPEAMPGWELFVGVPANDEDQGAEPDDEGALTVVLWSDGSLDDGQLLEFGLRARFPDEQDAVIEFPVVQRCGDVESEHAPTVTLTKRYGPSDVGELSATVARIDAEVQQLRSDVDQLQEQVGDVNVVNVRNRLKDTEKAVEDLDERVTALEDAGSGQPAEE